MGSQTERLRSAGGKSYLNSLLSLIFFALLAWVLYVLVPVQWANYQFEQAMEHEALYAGPQRRYASDIQRTLLLKAAELKLPIGAKALKIVRTTNQVEIEAVYEVPVTLFGFTYRWKQNPKVERAIYYY
ncbi:MAG TPA: hypothetical protein VGB99_16305 [Acidobacteriota bacterium]